jgi:hypothetical protein
MFFNFDSKSASGSSEGILDFLERIHRINKIEELEALIKTAATCQAKEVIIKDMGNLSLNIGQSIIAGIPVNISFVPQRKKVYHVKLGGAENS